MNNNIINFHHAKEQLVDSPALMAVKSAIDGLTDSDTNDLFYYLLTMGYPLEVPV